MAGKRRDTILKHADVLSPLSRFEAPAKVGWGAASGWKTLVSDDGIDETGEDKRKALKDVNEQ